MEDAAAQLRDIAPPVEVFPYPLWMVLAVLALAALALAALVYFIRRWIRSRPQPPPPTPRQRALDQLEAARGRIETMDPYGFSILLSDILRPYLSARYGLPATRQTSPEFLAAAAKTPFFNEAMREALERFLEKADLIKFARIDATAADSAELLERAIGIVKGEPS